MQSVFVAHGRCSGEQGELYQTGEEADCRATDQAGGRDRSGTRERGVGGESGHSLVWGIGFF